MSRFDPEIVDPAHANEQFRAQLANFTFYFRCADCVHFAPASGQCSLEFESRWLTTPELRMCTDRGRVVFCKHFEHE